MSELTWSDQEKVIIAKINGTKINSAPLKLVPRLEPRKDRLYIGPRKISEKQRAKIKEPFRSSCLRIATFKTTNPLMKLLDQDKSDP